MPGEANGVLQAFRQTGRPVPPAAEVGMDKGFFGYWQENQAKYHASSTSLPPVPAARALAEVTGRMLAGQGVKLNTLVAKVPVVDDATLADWGGPEVDAHHARHRLGQGGRLPSLQGARRVLRQPRAAGVGVSQARGRRARASRWRRAARP